MQTSGQNANFMQNRDKMQIDGKVQAADFLSECHNISTIECRLESVLFRVITVKVGILVRLNVAQVSLYNTPVSLFMVKFSMMKNGISFC